MWKFVIMSLMALSLSACAGNTLVTPTTPPTAITSAQDAAQKSLYAIGTALQATPGTMTALYDAGKISKADYNKVVPVYNQAVASYQLAVSALQTATKAGIDPSTATSYVMALQTFMTDKTNIDNLLTAFGQKPAGVAL